MAPAVLGFPTPEKEAVAADGMNGMEDGGNTGLGTTVGLYGLAAVCVGAQVLAPPMLVFFGGVHVAGLLPVLGMGVHVAGLLPVLGMGVHVAGLLPVLGMGVHVAELPPMLVFLVGVHELGLPPIPGVVPCAGITGLT